MRRVLAAALAVLLVGAPATASTDDPVPRLAGPDRYATGAVTARDQFGARAADDRPTAAVLARGDAYADALAGVPLAHHLDGPLLLTRTDALPVATADAMRDLLAPGATIHVLGGRAAVGAGVVDDLRASGWRVRRHAGSTRYATAAAVAEFLPPSATAWVASGVTPADALAAAPVAARTGAPVLLTEPDTVPDETRQALQGVDLVRVAGGPAAVAPAVVADLARAHEVRRVAGPDRFATAVAVAETDPTEPTALAIASGRAWPDALTGASHAAGTGAMLLLTEADRLPAATAAAVVRRQDLPAHLHGGAAVVAPAVERALRDAQASTVPLRASPEGFAVVAGDDAAVGSGGPVTRWTLEVEPGTGHAPHEVLPVVRAALEDPRRGWTAHGQHRLQRVGHPADAAVRVVLATPDTVDAYCARVGLNTAGVLSCWDGRRVMLNVRRWDRGAADFADLGTYRTYLVNHEVGHGLGHGHVGCPAAGAPAPVMMQQTKSTGACAPNGWPYP